MKPYTSWYRCIPGWVSCSLSMTRSVAAFLLLFPIPMMAQDAPQLTAGHLSVTVLVGYRTNMGLPIQPETEQSSMAFALAPSAAYGFALGLRARDEDLIEIRWTRQDSYVQVQRDNVALQSIPAITNQFHCDFSHEYVMPHREDRVRPYILGSVGVTNMFSGSSYSSTNISVGIGAGVKFFVQRHLGFRLQSEWLPMFMSPQRPALCGTGCVVHLGGSVASQAEVMFGPIIQF